MVAAVTLNNWFTPIAGLAPVVPIVPSLHKEIHRQYESYDGFTFVFKPFLDNHLHEIFDEPETIEILKVFDPLTYGEQLAKIPKFALHTSGDEFMDLTWPNIWYDEYK